MVTTDYDTDTADLLRQAEIKAEQLVALLRMVIAVALSISFVLAASPVDEEAQSVLLTQRFYAGATMVAYFALGLVSWIATRRGAYQPWMAWPAATADCAFLLAGVWLTVQNTNLPGSHIFIFPSIWLAPLIMTFGTLRYNPRLQAYITVVIVAGLFALSQITPPGSVAPQARATALFFVGGPNYMRLAILALAGLTLVVASMRTRAVLIRSITEAQDRVNLTRYLPAQIAPRLAKGGMDELRQGKHQPMGILFIDIRGFTSWSQGQSPEDVSQFMTEFRRRVTDVAMATGGIIDKFIGDAAMIVFESEAGDAQSAALACIQCGEGLDREMAEWSRIRLVAGDPVVKAGIGLHWGVVFSGVVGSLDRLEYSVFGDTVNTAARLEEMTKALGVDIVASRDILETAGLGPTPAGWTVLDDVPVRGRSGIVKILGRSISQ